MIYSVPLFGASNTNPPPTITLGFGTALTFVRLETLLIDAAIAIALASFYELAATVLDAVSSFSIDAGIS